MTSKYNSFPLPRHVFSHWLGEVFFAWRRGVGPGHWVFFRWCGGIHVYPQTPNRQFMREFFSFGRFGGAYAPGVPSSKSACNCHFKKGARWQLRDVQNTFRSRRNLFPAANLVNVSSSHPSCWGVCSITRASLATSESLATSAWLNKDGELGVKLPGKRRVFDQLNYENKSGMMDFEGSLGAWSTDSSRIPSLPLKNCRILVGILKHQGIQLHLTSIFWLLGCFWCWRMFAFATLQVPVGELSVFFCKQIASIAILKEVSEAGALLCGDDFVSRWWTYPKICLWSSDMF